MAELAARLYELPPPFASTPPLELVGDAPEQLARARELLESKGWRVGGGALAGGAPAGGARGGRPHPDGAALEEGVLWEPNEFLRGLVEQERCREAICEAGEASTSEQPVAVDLGCGNGRDAVYLALALGPGWTVYALDNHKGALERTRALAERSGVGDRVKAVEANLRAEAGLSEVPQAALVHGHRFLDKALLARLAADEGDRGPFIGPRGVFMWGHFLEGCEVLAPPRRKSLQLERGWMRSLFAPPRWQTLEDREATLNTRNETVPAQSFAVQRAPDGA